MFNFTYLALDILLIVLNVILLGLLDFKARTWPLIGIAVIASIYFALVDFNLYYRWINWDTTYLFSTEVYYYKLMIVVGLILAILRPPILILEVPSPYWWR